MYIFFKLSVLSQLPKVSLPVMGTKPLKLFQDIRLPETVDQNLRPVVKHCETCCMLSANPDPLWNFPAALFPFSPSVCDPSRCVVSAFINL